ncbi:hypothetical protein SporoP37_12765 [Sporosarcina sp. P37]|uniref:S-layer homology domain-containing protein n=1 Tax=unclassified Sporosarcina TaxID=2647733 RepID=UPI000A17EF9A|nr:MULTISPECIES: S-layer homology domain-containing protein [unclassified Sporosarcina]ARK25442.1 hypothetical protein SporoP37_12765 [Sporosarcina sp. P37]
MKSTTKNYKKYLTGVASAALVASAVAPVVSAADFTDVLENNSHKEAIDALSAAGVISGYPDGSFKPNKTLTRSDVVKLMGKWLVSMGYTIPTDYKTNPRFTDLTEKSNDELLQSAAIVKDNNVFRGYEDGSLKAAGSITRENMAIVLVRAYDAVNKTDLLSYVKEQEFDRDVVDLTKAKAEARPSIDVLDFFDITNPAAPNFRPKETTTRAQFASFLYKTSKVELTETPEAPEVAEITSVQAISDKQVELTGKNLQVLKADQLSIEDNELASFKANEDGTKATLELKNELTSGKEVTLTVTTKAENEGEEDTVTPYKFTYELKVEKVTATTTQVNANTADQKLAFDVDGKPADMKKLKDAGYTVEFQSTNTAVFSEQATGTLKALAPNTKFSYKVVVTNKDGKAVESDLVDVNVVDFGNTFAEISEVEVTQAGTKVESGKISLEDGEAVVKVTKAVTLNGVTKSNPAATYTSSNPSVATVTSDGKVTPISTGDVNIVAKVGDVTKNVKLTVGVGKRVATSATLSATDSKLIVGAKQDVTVTVKDQYNDLFNGELTVTSADTEIATAAVSASEEGVATVNVEAVKAGTTTIAVKSGDTVLGNIAVSVSDDKEVAARKFETVSAADDLTIDSIAGSKDATVQLAWKQFNSQGYFIENDKILQAQYNVISSNENVATVAKDGNGIVTVKAVKAGTADVQIKEGNIVRATATITVVNSTPTISSVDFEDTKVVTSPTIDQQVLKSEGIKLTSTEFVPGIDEEGNIFITNNNKTINLGTVAKSYSGNATDITGLKLEGGKITGTAKPGAQGTIVVSVKKEGQSTPVGTKSIEVNVPSN